MKLSGKQLHDLQQALLSAFPTRMALEQFVQFNLGENLNVIAGGETLADLVFSLVRWANSVGRIDELIREACVANPGNLELQSLASTISPIESPQIRILFLSADPTDLARLRLGEELREIQEKLQLASLRDKFKLEQRMSVRPMDLSQALLDVRPQIVHFSGHGSEFGGLIFETVNGEANLIDPGALEALFEQFTDQVQCVVLNACFSEAQANAIAHHIQYVVGMSQAVGDRAAIAFAIGFYQALGAGRTIEDAYQLGCVQIRLQGIPEHLTPVIITRGSTALA